ncbi:MAG: hypothetical protein P9M03_12445, partial [Candidatus Theseobacter exili]|nr:hypothetical protein [Candidatus Theseobacter exili]
MTSPQSKNSSGDQLNPFLDGLLPPIEEATIETLDPIRLLNPSRFDLMAKYIYASFKDSKLKKNWAFKLYEEHLKLFGGLVEGDGSGKTNITDYTNAFDETLGSINSKGFDPDTSILPVSRDLTLIDGSHRLAAALFYNKPVTVAKFNIDGPTYNFNYFTRRGLSSDWADAMALQYCKLNTNTFIAMLFPAAGSNTETAEKLLNEKGQIVYKKEFLLENEGPFNLIRQVYPK